MTIVVNLRDLVLWSILALVGVVLLGAWIADRVSAHRKRPK